MRIETISLHQFRNYSREKILFQSGLNLIRGKNAQGKTNIVEAVFLCCVGKSPRTPKDRDLIMWEKDAGYIQCVAERNIGRTSVEIYLTRKEKKRIQVNGIPINRMGELMGNIKAVYFHPDDLKLVKESPDCRRRFLDVDLSQLKKSYFYTLNRYQHILQQRNNLLKNASYQGITDTLDIWDVQLAAEGAKIVAERRKFCERLKGYAAASHGELTDGAEVLALEYEGEGDAASSEADVRELLYRNLKKNMEKDIRLGYTSVGPHRDDIAISANKMDLRQFGSQGQQRTAALSMKLAELELFAELTGEYPVLLLDDVLSELDRSRQRKLLEKVRHVQTILTCTYADGQLLQDIPYHVIDIQQGKVIKDEGKI